MANARGIAVLGRPAADALAARPPQAHGTTRLAIIDLARGAGIVGMVIYHLGWDFYFFGLSSVDVTSNLAWIIFARVVAGTFLLLVGIGLVLAHGDRIRWWPFLRRLAVIGAAAVVVSAATYLLFPQQFVYFGILHAVVVMSVLSLPFLVAPVPVVFLAAAFMATLPMLLRSDTLDMRFLAWIGFAEDPPPSVDFVPVLPWFSLTLLGIAGARLALRSQMHTRLSRLSISGNLARALQWTGRRSLAIYLLHQPILLGLLYAELALV